MKEYVFTFVLLTGFACYLCLLITGGLDLAYVKSFYLFPSALYFGYMTWQYRNRVAARFIAFSTTTTFFLVAALCNYGIIKDSYMTLLWFIGLNIVLLLIRLR